MTPSATFDCGWYHCPKQCNCAAAEPTPHPGSWDKTIRRRDGFDPEWAF